MITRALAMPEYVKTLISLQLSLFGLQPRTQDDVTICPLIYEDGSALSLVTMCIAKRGWFKETPMLVVSIVGFAETEIAVQIYFRELMAVPADDSDIPFSLRYSSVIKAMLVAHANISNMGRLVNRQIRAAKQPI